MIAVDKKSMLSVLRVNVTRLRTDLYIYKLINYVRKSILDLIITFQSKTRIISSEEKIRQFIKNGLYPHLI